MSGLVGEVPYVVDLQGGYIIPVTDDVDVLEPALSPLLVCWSFPSMDFSF